MTDESITAQVLRLARLRAVNSTVAFRCKDDHAIVEARIRADEVLRDRQLELVGTLPEGDTFRDTVEFAASLPQPPHLTRRYPAKKEDDDDGLV